MAGTPGDRHADLGTAPALSLRQLAAAPPSFDQALDDLIARAHETERAVGDDDVIASEPAAHTAFLDATTDPLGDRLTGLRTGNPATDPLGDRMIGDASASGVTDPLGEPAFARSSAAAMTDRFADSPDSRDDSGDPATDPFVTDPYADPTRSDASADATTDPFADPTRGKPRDAGDEHAEAYQLALRGQLAGLQRRVAVAEAHEPALREQLADLQRRLAAAEARQADAASLRRRIGLAVVLAFAAGLAVMFVGSRLAGERSGARVRGEPAASDTAPAGVAVSREPIVTPIDPPSAVDRESGASHGSSAAAGSASSPPAKSRSTSSGSGPGGPASTRPGAGAAGAGPASSSSAGSGRSPSSSGLVDPFADGAGAGSGSAAEPPTTSPPAGGARAGGEQRDAGAIVDPFGNR